MTGKPRFKKYKTLGHLKRRMLLLGKQIQDAEESTRAAREEAWCLYAQEQLLVRKKLRRR